MEYGSDGILINGYYATERAKATIQHDNTIQTIELTASIVIGIPASLLALWLSYLILTRLLWPLYLKIIRDTCNAIRGK